MPDWSYRTLSQPWLRHLPHDFGRRSVNRFLGGLSSLPLGYKVIEALGHMAPPESLRVNLGGFALSSPLLLAPSVDPAGRAVKAFSRFGFGALTLGPVSLEEVGEPRFRQTSRQTLISSGGPALGLQACRRVIANNSTIKFLVEIDVSLDSPDFADSCDRFVAALSNPGCALLLSPQRFSGWSQHLEANLKTFADLCRAASLPPFLGLPETGETQVEVEAAAAACQALNIGMVLSGHATDAQEWEWGGQLEAALQRVQAIRALAPQATLIVDGGVLQPADAIRVMQSGANAIIVSAGLVHGGPGLPKRINQALAEQGCFPLAPVEPLEVRVPERTAWFWGAALGLAMLFGAGLAGWVALTDVMLPYDEEFCGKTAPEISAFNPKVLSFMVHDRITLSGTMVSLGILYLALSWFEMRRGAHWAQRAIQISALSGFVSFFAFLGYGYFDPFHAMVAAILFQMLVQIVVLPAGTDKRPAPVLDLVNDKAWKLGLWGQLLFVVHGAALILAGTVILTYGMTVIFVPEDITYLGMDSRTLETFDPQLRALIAHDRATFGGMLVSAGLALLCTTLWGFRKGSRWLWLTYLLVIATPYAQTLWIHRRIGYWDQFHLLPVYIGIVLLIAGLVCSAPFLLARNSD